MRTTMETLPERQEIATQTLDIAIGLINDKLTHPMVSRRSMEEVIDALLDLRNVVNAQTNS